MLSNLWKHTRKHWAVICLAMIVISSSLLMLNHLGHRSITYWDESYHALTARNLLKHPLKFTLVDRPWLPYDYKFWGLNHVWLHKPPLSMWGIALSFAILGVNAFALRLPSLLLSGGAVILTYLIGTQLFDKRVGLIAAFWQAFNACVYRLAHGYLFSDHVDIAVLFWVETSCYLLIRALRSGNCRTYMLCGIAQGLGFLSKSYLGFLAFGVSGAIWLLARLRAFPEEAYRIKPRHLLMQISAAVITIAPWTIYSFVKYPKEFLYENWYVLVHLNKDIESWGATWDRPLFDYMMVVVPIIYSAVIAAALLVLYESVRKRSWQDAFVFLWIAGVVVAHSVAKTKTPSATLIGMPALIIGLSVIMAHGLFSTRHAAFWLAMGIVMLKFPGGKSNVAGRDTFDSLEAFAPYLKANLWIVWRVAGILSIGIIVAVVAHFTARIDKRRLFHWAIVISALVLTVPLGFRSVRESKLITDTNRDNAKYLQLGHAIQQRFPENACFFLKGAPVGIYQELMFYSDRTVYDLGTRDLKADAAIVKENGGLPYLIRTDKQPGQTALDYSKETGYYIYALDDQNGDS